jgi:hypothetical protein
MSGMFGTALNPATLIRKQWIAKEYVASDLFFIGRRDKDYENGYKPHIMEFEKLIDIIEDAIELSFTDLTDTPSQLGSAGQILEVNLAGDGLIFTDPLDEFTDLIDTPVSYVGYADYHVVVNPTEDGLVFEEPKVLPDIYEARLLFNFINNPTEQVQFINELGVTVTWTRTGPGIYIASFSAAVDSNKLVAYINNSSTGTFHIGSYTANSIQFIHDDNTGVAADCNGQISVEIKLYP